MANGTFAGRPADQTQFVDGESVTIFKPGTPGAAPSVTPAPSGSVESKTPKGSNVIDLTGVA